MANAQVTIRDTLRDRLRDNWSGGSAQIIELYSSSDEPAGEAVLFDLPLPGATQESIGAPGNNVIRYEGILYLHIQTGPGQGDMRFREMADELHGLFAHQRIGDVLVEEMIDGEESATGNRIRVALGFVFSYDDRG